MTQPKTLKIDDVEYVRTDSVTYPLYEKDGSLTFMGLRYVPASQGILKQDDRVVLVRTRSAGVHVGEVGVRNGTDLTLLNAHRVWRWKGANTLSELSQKGGDMGYTRISEMVPGIQLTEVIEMIACSVEAAKNLRTPRWPG